MSAPWTTRLEPELTRPFGVEELHNVCFEPINWPGKGTVVSLLVPECELQVVVPSAGEERYQSHAASPVAYVNRPQVNHNVKYWIRLACELATKQRAFLTFSCNTAEQAERAARRAAQLLPRHYRAALERLIDPKSRARGKLS